VTFAQMAQARTATVRQIAAGRFDWHAAMLDLAKVVPGNTSLQSLVATASPSSSGVGGAGASVLRSDISSPAFELTGCTATQDDVARLMSRLRLMSGVTRVTLGSAVKTEGPQPGASISTTTPASASGTSQNQGCGPNTPAFDLVVFFQLPAASLPSTGGVK
jgi:Tfp pilus assembly protein PilN